MIEVLRHPVESALAPLVAVMDELGPGLCRATAMVTAWMTSSLVCRLPIDQPTSPRPQRSRTPARKSLPSPVENSVMSATHRSLGLVAEKSRLRRSPAGATSSRPRLHFLRAWTPTRSSWAMSRATRLRPTRVPSRQSSPWILGAP
jgi:hypothetical protein